MLISPVSSCNHCYTTYLAYVWMYRIRKSTFIALHYMRSDIPKTLDIEYLNSPMRRVTVARVLNMEHIQHTCRHLWKHHNDLYFKVLTSGKHPRFTVYEDCNST